MGVLGSGITKEERSLPADPIKVLLADDHTMFREGLAGLLASYGGMEVVGSAPNGEEDVALAERTRPDVVLMQVQMPFEKASDILSRMRAVSPTPKVVIVTMFENPRYLRELMSLGTSAYLIKSASTQHLIGAIRAAVFDPKGENVVVGMPREMLEDARRGSGACSRRGSWRYCFWPPAASPTARSARTSTSPKRRSGATSLTPTPRWGSPPARRRPGWPCRRTGSP
jgi:DNA-binding NarL/FixJ family response regulator